MGNSLSRITKNIGLITAANLIVRVLGLVLQAMLARSFGASGLGAYVTATTLAAYFLFLVDFGLAPRLIREGAVNAEALEQEYARAMGIKLVAAGFALLLLAGLYFVLPYEMETRKLCVWFAVGSVLHSISYLNQAICQARENVTLPAIAEFVHTLLFVLLTILCYALEFPLEIVGVTFLLAAIVRLLLTGFFARRYIRLDIFFPPHLPTARAAIPYAVTSLTSVAFAQVDILILSIIANQSLVGEYASISRLLLAIGVLSGLAGTAALPTIARLFTQLEPTRFVQMLNDTIRTVVLLGGFVAVVLFTTARWVITLLYGKDFEFLYPWLQLGSFYLMIQFLSSVLQVFLTAAGRQSLRARALLIGLAATVVLILILVPPFGVGGAVATLLLSEVVLMGNLSIGLKSFISTRSLVKTALLLALHVGPSIGCFILLTWIGVPFLWSISAPALLYVAMNIVTGEFARIVLIVRSMFVPSW